MMYDAKDIGRATVRLSIENKCWISNLKLQKLLYFSWLEYYKAKKVRLFEDEFEAWKYGPVVPSVYYDNWRNVANILRVPKPTSVEIDNDTLVFLKTMLEKYETYTAREMVDLSHNSKPWSKNYEERKKNVIPILDMEEEALLAN